jgi:demethylmenaquinone methyltransferase/2-methoxy-6-polyprenyl-1,4-benzoquinol methylase
MDVEKIKRKYRWKARVYDRLIAAPTVRLRREAVRRLALAPGNGVLDLGCGTGLSLPLLRAAVGDAGLVYGVELSPDMLATARTKVAAAGWANVRLIEANAETFEIDQQVDAILCFYTHDIMLSPTALPRAVTYLKPGGRVVAAGGKLVHGWRGWLINPVTVAYSLPAVTTLDRKRSYEPFAVMRPLLAGFGIKEYKLGSQYLAWGTRPTAQ